MVPEAAVPDPDATSAAYTELDMAQRKKIMPTHQPALHSKAGPTTTALGMLTLIDHSQTV